MLSRMRGRRGGACMAAGRRWPDVSMRRLGDRAMSGAERTRRWRQHRWERGLRPAIAADVDARPAHVDSWAAEVIITAWRRRGLRYAITTRQWSTIPAAAFRDPSLVRAAAQAIADAPGRPAPASAVWGSLLQVLQGFRARLAAGLSAMRAALAPRVPAQAHHRPTPPPDSAGYQAWRAVGEVLRRRLPT